MQMKLDCTAANEWVRNAKTGSIGLVMSRYIDARTNKPKVEVAIMGIKAVSHRAYWLKSSVEDHHA